MQALDVSGAQSIPALSKCLATKNLSINLSFKLRENVTDKTSFQVRGCPQLLINLKIRTVFAFALTHPLTPLIWTEMHRVSSVPVHRGDMYPLFIQRPFEVSTNQLDPVYTDVFLTENANFSLQIATPFFYTKTVKTHENVFTLKTLSKVETFEKATIETLCKCCVNDENVNAETVFYQAWSRTKIGVD